MQSGRDARPKPVIAAPLKRQPLQDEHRLCREIVSAFKCDRRRLRYRPAAVSVAGEDNESLPAVSATPCFQGQLAAPSMHRGPQ